MFSFSPSLSFSLYLSIYLALALVVSSHKISREREMKRERDGKRELPFVLAGLPFFSTRNDRHVVTSRLFYTHLHVRTSICSEYARVRICVVCMVRTGNLYPVSPGQRERRSDRFSSSLKILYAHIQRGANALS